MKDADILKKSLVAAICEYESEETHSSDIGKRL